MKIKEEMLIQIKVYLSMSNDRGGRVGNSRVWNSVPSVWSRVLRHQGFGAVYPGLILF